MFKQILTTVCVAAIMSAGSVALADNSQEQGSLSNQANVSENSNSNVSDYTNVTGTGGYTDNSTVDDNSTVHSTSNSNNSSTSIANTNGYVASVPIIASAGTCLGSVGGTISAAGIGIGSSKTIVDEECNKRQQQQLDSNVKAQEAVTRANTVRLLNELGLGPAALSLLCQDPATRLALKAGLEPVVYNKVCKVYEPDLENIANLTSTSEY